MSVEEFRTFEIGKISRRSGYQLLTGLVVPRPIGWIGSASPEGFDNLAPFSFFNAVSGDPPTVLFSVGSSRAKDTLSNVTSSGDFSVNIVTRELATAMKLTSQAYPPDVDEFAMAELTKIPSIYVDAPRVAEAAAQMECRVSNIVKVGRSGDGNTIVIGEVVAFHVSPSVLLGTTIDPSKLVAVGRHAGDWYSAAERLFELK